MRCRSAPPGSSAHWGTRTREASGRGGYFCKKIHYLEITLEDDENDPDNPEKVLYYRFPIFNGTAYTYVKAGSDGSLRLDPDKQSEEEVEKAITMRVFTDTKGTDFNIGLVSAANGDITIMMTDPNGSILDGDGTPDDMDIYAPDGTVLIISESTGKVGEEDNPLEIAAKLLETRNFETEVDEEVVETETHLYVEEGDLIIDKNVLVDGVIWDIKTKDGSIIFADSSDAEKGDYDLTVINGGTAEIATNKLELKKGVYIDNDSAASEGRVVIDEIAVTGAADGTVSKLFIDAEGDVITANETYTNAFAEITSREGGFTAPDIALVGSDVTITAGEDGEVHEIRAYGSDLTMVMGGDLRFDNAIVRKTDLTLEAGGILGMRADGGNDCSEYGQHAFIQIDEADGALESSIKLSGKESIGERDNTLIVDIPETIILQIPEVGDLFLDSLELIPQKVNANCDPEYIRITADDLKFGIDSVTHPDNPKVNEYTGTEVESHETIDGDYLAHIIDEIRTEKLPFQTVDEIVGRIMDQNGDDWLSIVNSDAVVQILEDSKANKDLVAIATEDQINAILNSFRTNNSTASSMDKDLAKWVIENSKEYPELKEKLESGVELSDKEILSVVNGYKPSGKEAVEDWRNKKINGIVTAKDEDDSSIGATALWDAIKETDSEEETAALLAALLEIQLSEGGAVETINDLEEVLMSLLSEEEIEAIKQVAIDEAEMPEEAEAGYTDEEPKSLNIEIGKATGVANIYNDGDITVTVTETSDFTAEYIRSERGDVSITVEDGSLLSTDSDNENILGGNVDLNASEDIKANSGAIDLQQRDNKPAVVVNVADANGSGNSAGSIRMDEDGNWVFDVNLTYDWVRKDIEDATMRLDAEAENGSIALNEIEGGTGVGVILAGEDVELKTDGDLTDVRTDEEIAEGKDNITSGDDTVIEVPNGAAGTSEDPIEVNIGGHMTADTKDDIHVVSNEDLEITADTQDGTVTVSTDGNLVLDNTDNAAHSTGEITIYAEAGGNAEVNIAGSIRATSEITAGGDADITAGGDIISAAVKAGDDAEVTAHGDIIRTDVEAGDTAYVEAAGSVLAESNNLIEGDNVIVKADADGDGIGNVGTSHKPISVDTSSGNTGSGTLEVAGAEVYVKEVSGDLVIDQVSATEGNAEITAPGSITDINDEDLLKAADEALKEASDADNIASTAEDRANVLNEEAKELEDKADKAESDAESAREEAEKAKEDAKEAAEAVNKLKDEINKVNDKIKEIESDPVLSEENKAEQIIELNKQKEDLEKQLSAKEKEAQEAADKAKELNAVADGKEEAAADAREEADKARETADKAFDEAKEKREEADKAQAKADDLIERAGKEIASITTEKDLTIHSGGDVGSHDNSLNLDVGGSLTIGAQGDVIITNNGDLHIADLDADGNADEDRDVSITANGDLTSDAVITGNKADINTLSGGNVGSSENPFSLDVNEINGTIAGDATLTNEGDLQVNDLTVGGKLELTVGGDLTAGDMKEDTANITAKEAVISADGDVGTKEKPIVTAVDTLSVTGENTNIHSITDLEINSITGKDVVISVDGKTTAGDSAVNITADNLDLSSYGSVGTKERPLVINVSGNVNITNVYGHQFTNNVYSIIEELVPTTSHWTVSDEEEVTPAPVSVIKPNNSNGNEAESDEKEWALTNFILALTSILMALLLLWLYLRKKKRGESMAKDNVRLAALAPAVASLTTYLLTEDMQGKMVAADKWTALMLLYFVAEMGILYYTEKQRDPTKEQ